MATHLWHATMALREFALSFPEAWEDFPWEERVIKVGKKIFVFMGKADLDGLSLGLCVKLPKSGADVLLEDYAEPGSYGTGKHGWVAVQFSGSDEPPLDRIREWIDESYRAVATKKLVKVLDERQTG